MKDVTNTDSMQNF